MTHRQPGGRVPLGVRGPPRPASGWAAVASGDSLGSEQLVEMVHGPDPHRALAATLRAMCRNIRTLHNFEPPATESEIHDAALQYVRKISGTTKPSRINEPAFERAVQQIALASAGLLDDLVTAAPPKSRELEAAKRRARASQRYAA